MPTDPATMPPADTRAEETDLLTYARVLLQHWWILAPLTVLGAAAGLGYSLTVPPLFRATCKYEIYQNTSLDLGHTDQRRPRYWRYSPIDRHIKLLQSATLNEQVAEKLAPDWPGTGPTNVSVNPDAPEGDSDNLTDILAIQVDSTDPRYSLEYISELLTAYDQRRKEEGKRRVQESIRNLKEEKAKRERELEQARAELEAFKTEHGIAFRQEQDETDRKHLARLLDQKRRMQTQINVLDQELAQLDNKAPAQLGNSLEQVVSAVGRFNNLISPQMSAAVRSENQRLQQVITRMELLHAEYQDMTEVYKPKHPKMVEKQEEIKKVERELNAYSALARQRLESIADTLKLKLNAVSQSITDIQKRLQANQGLAARHESLQGRIKHLTALYDQVDQRIIDISSANEDKYFSHVIDGPFTSETPVWPNKRKLTLLGAMGGGGLATLLIMLLYFRRLRLYNFRHVEETSQVPCLADIPAVKSRDVTGPFFLNEQPRSAIICEAYRHLRTTISQELDENSVLLVSSPQERDGKTFTAVNLACVYAWHCERVLLVDGDFRKATLRKAFPDTPVEGLVECLEDPRRNWHDAVVRDIAPNLDYLPAGHSGDNAAELLDRPQVEEIFAGMRQTYQMVIVDSAPASQIVDTALLAEHADAALLVVRPSHSRPEAVQHALHRLHHATVIGMILNSMTPGIERYSSYSAKSHYGYAKSYYAGNEYR